MLETLRESAAEHVRSSAALKHDARGEMLAQAGRDGIQVLAALSAQREGEGRRGCVDRGRLDASWVKSSATAASCVVEVRPRRS